MVVGRYRAHKVLKGFTLEPRIHDHYWDSFLHGSSDWAPERCVVNRRQNNAAHSLGNDLLNDLDLLRRVVFLQGALPYHLHTSFFCAFTCSLFDRFPKKVCSALRNYNDWIHGAKAL